MQHHQVEKEPVPNPTHPNFLIERISGTVWGSTLWVKEPIEFPTPSLLPRGRAQLPPLNVIAFTNPLKYVLIFIF